MRPHAAIPLECYLRHDTCSPCDARQKDGTNALATAVEVRQVGRLSLLQYELLTRVNTLLGLKVLYCSMVRLFPG